MSSAAARAAASAPVPLEVVEQHQELVAAVAREHAARLLDAAEPRRDPAQQPVAGRVPERVVDQLEVVEVDEQQRHRAVAPARAGDRGAQPDVELRAVGQARQRVVEGEPAQLGLGLLQPRLGELAVGDVDHHALGVRGPPGRVAHDRRPLPEPHDGAVGGDHPVLGVERGLLGVGAALAVEHARAVLRVQPGGPQALVGDPGLGREAEQPLDLGRDEAQRGVGRPVGDIGDRLDLLDQRAVALLALDRAVGHVDERADEARHLVVAPGHGGDRQLVPERRAVAPQVQQRDAAALAAVERGADLGDGERVGVLALQEAAVAAEHLSAG